MRVGVLDSCAEGLYIVGENDILCNKKVVKMAGVKICLFIMAQIV